MKKLILMLAVGALLSTEINAQSFAPGTSNQLVGKNSSGSTSPLNIGIGTSNPTQKLHIVGDEATTGRTFLKLHNTNTSASSATILTIANGVSDSKAGSLTYTGPQYTYANGKFADALNVFCNGNVLNLEMANPDGSTSFTVGKDVQNFPIEKMRLNKTGFGIGTENPTAILNTKGKVKMESLDAGNSFILTRDADGTLKSGSVSLTDLNATITDLKTRLATAEDDIKALKKKVGLFQNPDDTNNKAALSQNQPNPANASTIIKFELKDVAATALILVMDIQGRLVDQYKFTNVSGKNEITIPAKKLETGMYFYTLLVDGREIDTKKMFITE